MKAFELIQVLQENPNQEVMILDGFNAGGVPRTINVCGERTVCQEDADETSDCEGLVGEKILVLGFGSY